MISVAWHNSEKTIMVMTMVTPWSWEEYHQTTAEMYALLDSVRHKVDVILDFTESTHLPPNAFSHLRNLDRKTHTNRGTVILVGFSKFLQVIADVLVKLYPSAAKSARMVRTLDEAYAVAAEIQSQREAVV
jgi:hypothetical protein